MNKLFSIDQNILFEKTRILLKIIPDNPHKALIQSYRYIKIKTKDQSLLITACNNENSITVTVDGATFGEQFEVVVDSSFLNALVNRDLETTFSLEGNRCFINCVGSKWEVPILNPNEFAEIADTTYESILEFDVSELEYILHKIKGFTIDSKQSSINSNCYVHFKSNKNYLSIGATTNAVCCAYKLDKKCNEVNTLMTPKTASLVEKLCSLSPEDTIYVSRSPSTHKYETESYAIYSVNPAFKNEFVHDLHRMISNFKKKEYDTISIFDKGYFIEQVKKAIAFTSIDNKILAIDIEESKLLFKIEDYINSRKSNQEMDCLVTRTGDATRIGLNYEMVLRVLGCIEDTSIEIKIPLHHGGENNRCITEAILIDDSGFNYLIAPLMI